MLVLFVGAVLAILMMVVCDYGNALGIPVIIVMFLTPLIITTGMIVTHILINIKSAIKTKINRKKH